MSNVRIGFLGCGNLGQALLKGWLSAGAVAPSNIAISSPNTAMNTAKRFGVRHMGAEELIAQSDIVVLGMKPHQISAATQGLQFREGQIALSVLAGATLQQLRSQVGAATVVRTMPNLAAASLSGVTLIARGDAKDAAAVNKVRALCEAFGVAVILDD